MTPPAAPLPWDQIDTVLLDMDGTLLDLRFDNWFWQEYLPTVYAAAHDLEPEAALAALMPRFAAARGRLDWYCIDYWSRELGLDIPAIKRGVREQVAWIPGAEAFLARLVLGKRRVLVADAHPETLAIKDEHVDLIGHLDAVYSTHPFGAPKEDPAFWPRLAAETPFDPARTLFVDDSLPVLAAAHGYGIAWLRAIHQPRLGRPARNTAGFVGVDSVAELL